MTSLYAEGISASVMGHRQWVGVSVDSSSLLGSGVAAAAVAPPLSFVSLWSNRNGRDSRLLRRSCWRAVNCVE